eukprot:1335777-Amorphochlora_amoeboformis.AAC.2
MSQTTFPAMGAALVAGAISVWVIDRFSTHIAPLREAFARRWASSTVNHLKPPLNVNTVPRLSSQGLYIA